MNNEGNESSNGYYEDVTPMEEKIINEDIKGLTKNYNLKKTKPKFSQIDSKASSN